MPCASGSPARELNEERTYVDEDEEDRGGSAVLAVGRPLQSLLMATGVLAVAAAYVLLPGLAAVFGLAPAPVSLGQWTFEGVPGMRMVIFSLLLLGIILFRREGIMGTRELTWKRIGAFLRRHKA